MRALFMSRDLLLARARSTTALRHSPRMGCRVDSLLPCMRRRVIKSAHRLPADCPQIARRLPTDCPQIAQWLRPPLPPPPPPPPPPLMLPAATPPPCPHEPVPMTRTTATSYGLTSCGTKQLTHIPFGGARHGARHGACPPHALAAPAGGERRSRRRSHKHFVLAKAYLKCLMRSYWRLS